MDKKFPYSHLYFATIGNPLSDYLCVLSNSSGIIYTWDSSSEARRSLNTFDDQMAVALNGNSGEWLNQFMVCTAFHEHIEDLFPDTKELLELKSSFGIAFGIRVTRAARRNLILRINKVYARTDI